MRTSRLVARVFTRTRTLIIVSHRVPFSFLLWTQAHLWLGERKSDVFIKSLVHHGFNTSGNCWNRGSTKPAKPCFRNHASCIGELCSKTSASNPPYDHFVGIHGQGLESCHDKKSLLEIKDPMALELERWKDLNRTLCYYHDHWQPREIKLIVDSFSRADSVCRVFFEDYALEPRA
ncbi:hypothetical protein VNO77_19471 [Canavalia gladiata]|uniref:Uncharacterized protein n=1 Tax=Canavalia gladiata TaxID=3824 RepID=A0AAN9QPM8_CANGL